MEKCRIMIVEDERIVARDIASRLDTLGYSVAATVSSGEQAVEDARTLRPDLILMDIMLKGDMDGITAAEIIKRDFNIPIIFLTAYADDVTLGRAKAASPFGYLLKPINDQELRVNIEISLHKHKLEDKMRKARDMAEAADRAKSLFLANMSHEVRTPMNVILGMTELTLDTRLTDEQRENLQMVYDSAKSLLGLLNSVIEFSKIEARKSTLDAVEFDLRERLEEAMKPFALAASQKGVKLSSYVDESIPPTLKGDAGKLMRVITIVVDNAVKFTEEGEVAIEVKKQGIEAGGQPLETESSVNLGEELNSKLKTQNRKPESIALLFTVSDTGIGIPAEHQESIFKAFTQVDGSSTRAYNGAGLGLAVAKKTVQMMGGAIWVQSKISSGSTFHFVVPVERVSDKDFSATAPDKTFSYVSETPDKTNVHSSSVHILIAEDNAVNRLFVESCLKKSGYSTESVKNGKDVLDRLSRHAYDLVLMDVEMPVMGGLEAAQMIRDSKSGLFNPNIPIIFASGHVLDGDGERFTGVNVNGYISKPFDPEKLRKIIEENIQTPSFPGINEGHITTNREVAMSRGGRR